MIKDRIKKSFLLIIIASLLLQSLAITQLSNVPISLYQIKGIKSIEILCFYKQMYYLFFIIKLLQIINKYDIMYTDEGNFI